MKLIIKNKNIWLLSSFLMVLTLSGKLNSNCNSKRSKLDHITFAELLIRSEYFNKKTQFPTKANRIKSIGIDEDRRIIIENQANATNPIMTSQALDLIANFVKYKQKHGSKQEQSLYTNISNDELIDRLLTKRPLVFMTESDLWRLADGLKGKGGFETIGTQKEKAPLTLKNYISYDEMQIAALIGVSVPTYFINNGNRLNRGAVSSPDDHEENGIYVGLVGARFEKPGLMEWQHMIITPEQNNLQNGYGEQADKNDAKTGLIRIWSSFYKTTFATFDEAEADKSGRFVWIKKNMYLDTEIYKKRMRMVIEPFILNANKLGIDRDEKVYCHIVGLGLGVWQISPIQAKLMLEVYSDILNETELSAISDLDFSWFPPEYQSICKLNDTKIKIHFSKRNPADKLTGDNRGKLLVAMYAWDGNSYPGNEYWDGNLTGSGDPAAACCSTIAELQNPLINPNVAAKNMLYY